MSRVTIDTVTYDPTHDEYVLYLVEDGPWPTDDKSWDEMLAQIQTRVFDAIDVAVDGHLQTQYPDSVGKPVRIQVDSPHGMPEYLRDLVSRIRDHLGSDSQYREAITSSRYAKGIRIVTGEEMGRFTAARH